MTQKHPVSVLVLVHTAALEVLLIERAARAGWPGEPLAAAALREVREETGIEAAAGDLLPWNLVYTFEIYPQWRHRFTPGTTHNTEHVFSLELPARVDVSLAPEEHRASRWLGWREAAAECFSWSNRDAIRILGERSR